MPSMRTSFPSCILEDVLDGISECVRVLRAESSWVDAESAAEQLRFLADTVALSVRAHLEVISGGAE